MVEGPAKAGHHVLRGATYCAAPKVRLKPDTTYTLVRGVRVHPDPHGLNKAQKFADVVDAMSASARQCRVASAATMCVT